MNVPSVNANDMMPITPVVNENSEIAAPLDTETPISTSTSTGAGKTFKAVAWIDEQIPEIYETSKERVRRSFE